ncbi:MAG TPA: hypothetical protein VHK01_05840, partial [Lacipirellulaceae bacterium]|nr:hypothetical protein [Lacipirellulaceae bacterium]
VPTTAELIMLLNNLGRLGPQATAYDVGQSVINTRPLFLANNGLGWVNNINAGSQTAHALMFNPHTAISPWLSSQYGMINPHVYADVQNFNQYHNQGYGATNFNFQPLGNLGQVSPIVGMLQGVNVGVPTLPIAGTMMAGFGPPIGSLPQHQMHNYGSYGGWF